MIESSKGNVGNESEIRRGRWEHRDMEQKASDSLLAHHVMIRNRFSCYSDRVSFVMTYISFIFCLNGHLFALCMVLL